MSARTDMLVQDYLESLLNSRVAMRLVRGLIGYPGRIFTVRRLAEVAGVSPSEAAVVVKELEKRGILRIQPVGKAYLVSPNDKSYILNKILKPMIVAEEQTLSELISVLAKHLDGREIFSAALFGSVPRGEARDDSDIDLLVISNDFDAASVRISQAREEVISVFSARLSPLIMSRKELDSKAGGKLVGSILEKYIHVAGKDLKELIARR